MTGLLLTTLSYLVRLASLSLADSPPKNMSDEIDFALPNLLTASVLEGPEDTGGAAARLGLRKERSQ